MNPTQRSLLSRRFVVIALLVAWASSLWLLLSGSTLLVVMLPGQLPVGSLVATVFLGAPAFLAVGLSRVGTLQNRITRAITGITLTWFPVSALLAGNLRLSFHDFRFEVWLGFTLVTAGLSFGALFAALLSAWLRRRRQRISGP